MKNHIVKHGRARIILRFPGSGSVIISIVYAASQFIT